VYEHELDELARGSPASLYLNFALFLAGLGVTSVTTLLTATIENDRIYQGYFIVSALALLFGTLFGILWRRGHSAVGDLIVRIKDRMPASEPIRESEGA